MSQQTSDYNKQLDKDSKEKMTNVCVFMCIYSVKTTYSYAIGLLFEKK